MTHAHNYRATVVWEGSTGLGYYAYGRDHDVSCPPATTSLTVSSDPAYGGDSRLLNPEQLLLAAAASCQLLSFLAVAARSRITVVAYQDEAEAVMPEDDAPMRITSITLRPTITVSGDVTDERLQHLVDVAHRECFIANSLRSEMTITPSFRRT
jgi:organic hydroperoxide reductase OsmC/OhrA